MMTKDKYSVSAYFSQVEPILFYCPSNILKRAGKNWVQTAYRKTTYTTCDVDCRPVICCGQTSLLHLLFQ